MKLSLAVALAILSPVWGKAELAGDWAGVLTCPQQSLHFVLHVRGPDTALRARSDSPDQNQYGFLVHSMTLSGSTLRFTIPFLDVQYSGDVNANGSIVGTFTQRGTALPLVLERTVATPRPAPPPLTEPPGVLQNGRYHHNLTGVEFNLPAGWSVALATPADGDPRTMTVLVDPDHKALFASVAMNKVHTNPENISAALSRALTEIVARRGGETGWGQPHLAKNYKIREGSVEQTLIGGQKALRAIADYERDGMKISELLTWIFTEHTRAYFFAQMRTENLPALRMTFEQILQSATIP